MKRYAIAMYFAVFKYNKSDTKNRIDKHLSPIIQLWRYKK